MSNPYPCFECQALAEEFRSTCAEIEASPSLSGESRAAYEALLALAGGREPRLSEQSGAAQDAVRRMIGGTEEDAERAEDLLNSFQQRPLGPEWFRGGAQCGHPKLLEVIRRMAVHRMRTGHLPVSRP